MDLFRNLSGNHLNGHVPDSLVKRSKSGLLLLLYVISCISSNIAFRMNKHKMDPILQTQNVMHYILLTCVGLILAPIARAKAQVHLSLQ